MANAFFLVKTNLNIYKPSNKVYKVKMKYPLIARLVDNWKRCKNKNAPNALLAFSITETYFTMIFINFSVLHFKQLDLP